MLQCFQSFFRLQSLGWKGVLSLSPSPSPSPSLSLSLPLPLPPPLSLSLSLSLSRELMEADVVMSPVRRSLRLAEKFVAPGYDSHGNYQVSSLAQLPTR